MFIILSLYSRFMFPLYIYKNSYKNSGMALLTFSFNVKPNDTSSMNFSLYVTRIIFIFQLVNIKYINVSTSAIFFYNIKRSIVIRIYSFKAINIKFEDVNVEYVNGEYIDEDSFDISVNYINDTYNTLRCKVIVIKKFPEDLIVSTGNNYYWNNNNKTCLF